MKFGGTSVGDVSRIKAVADIVVQFRRDNPGIGVVVVLSAMAGETNKLVALAKSCVDEPAPRELDVLLASGEQVTIALLAMRLSSLGTAAKSMLGPQAQISTNSRHTNALIEEIDTASLRAGAVGTASGTAKPNPFWLHTKPGRLPIKARCGMSAPLGGPVVPLV